MKERKKIKDEKNSSNNHQDERGTDPTDKNLKRETAPYHNDISKHARKSIQQGEYLVIAIEENKYRQEI